MIDALEKPTMFQRAKGAVKGFFNKAVDYIPRGIVLIGLLYAGSAVLETAMGIPGFGVVGASSAKIFTQFATHLTVGTALFGALGALMGLMNPASEGITAAPTPAATPAAAPSVSSGLDLAKKLSEGLAEHAEKSAPSMVADSIVPGAGLPMTLANKFVTTTTPNR